MLPSPSSTLNVRDVVEAYLRHANAIGLHSKSSKEDRLRTFKKFVGIHGDLPVSQCKAYHLSDWIESQPTWTSSSTRKNKAAMIKAAFAWALLEDRIDRNPFVNVRYEESERRPDLPDNVLELVQCLANKPFERVLKFLRYTGCRLAEMAEAKWQDIDPVRGIWTIHRHKSRRYTGKPKLVALVDEAIELLSLIARMVGREELHEHIAKHGDEIVFVNNWGRPWSRSALGDQLRRTKEKFGIKNDATLHGIRHRFGSASVAAGAPIKLVAQQMGHISITTTERYYVDLTNEIDSVREAIKLGIPRKS